MLRKTQLLRNTYWKQQTPSVYKSIRENSILDSPFTADIVSRGIAQLKNKKSRNDLINNEMIKTGSPTLLPFLVTFLTLC